MELINALSSPIVNRVYSHLKTEVLRDNSNWAQDIWMVPELWRQSLGAGVKVAVLDTGIDLNHADFKNSVISHRDFTGTGIQDGDGHGTHCAGIVGARGGKDGFTGIAPSCDLIIGKVVDNQGRGSLDQLSEGIAWAVEEGAEIISISLGYPFHNNRLHKIIHEALAKGATICAAAGNSGSMNPVNIDYPGIYGGLITVGAHDEYGNPTGFSSRGGELDVLAPGKEVFSTYKDQGYASLSGTSMATPMVAGLCALILAKHKKNPNNRTPVENCDDLRQHLLRMAAHNGYHSNTSGYGPIVPLRNFSIKSTK